MSIENISLRISSRMVNKAVIQPSQLDRVAYGLSLILSALIITVAIFSIGALTGMIVPCLIYSVWYWFVRNIVGLHHCNTYIKCFSLSVGLYSIMTLCYKFSVSQYMPLAWLLMGSILLVYRGIEITWICEVNARVSVAARYKKLCIFSGIGAAIVCLGILMAARPLSFPISYGIFVTSLLFSPGKHKRHGGE